MSVIEEEWRRKVGYLSILFRENGHLTKKLPWKLGQMSIGGMSANRRTMTIVRGEGGGGGRPQGRKVGGAHQRR